MGCLFCGDISQISQTIDKGIASLAVTSPPYPGQRGCDMSVGEWMEWMEFDVLPPIHGLLDESGVLALNAMFKRKNGWFDHRVFNIPAVAERRGFYLIDVYIWDKVNPVPSGPLSRADISGWEPIFLFTKDRDKNYPFYPVRKEYAEKTVSRMAYGRGEGVTGMYTGGHAELDGRGARQSNVLSVSPTGDGERPRSVGQSFPVGLPERFILQHTRPGEVVLDPFCGVGTTCYAAKKHNRGYVGIDINEEEVILAAEWLETIEGGVCV